MELSVSFFFCFERTEELDPVFVGDACELNAGVLASVVPEPRVRVGVAGSKEGTVSSETGSSSNS